MPNDDFPTDPNAETIGLPSDDGGKGSVPELGKHVTEGMPSEIGRYKILGIIASGGMGVVYEAMQEAPRRRVALKVIKAGAASEMALHRFDFESQILAKLRHPNIAQIYEAGTWESEQGPAPFFAMEYIPGRKGLIEYADKSDLSLKERLVLFSKICDAVHHAHQKAVIHRDLKPDNILVDSSGEPKIIDFGVARATDADMTVTTMQTTMGQLIGTLQYMSPEQCEADPDLIDTRSDVYALGVILFQLLSGKLPYDLRRQAIHEAVRVIKEQRPDSMSTINTSLKGDVDTITMKALEKERDRRYQSAAELAGDIHHFLNSEPIIARPLSMTYQITLFTKKYKRTCAAVVLLAISVVLGLIGTGYGMQQARIGWAAADVQLARVESRNEVLGNNLDDLTFLLGSNVKDLGNSAEVQRSIIEIAKQSLEGRKEGEGNSADRAELVGLLMRYAKSIMSVSSVGYGEINDAQVALDEAKEVLESIDMKTLTSEDFDAVNAMKLDHPKLLVELIKTRALDAEDEKVKSGLLRQAIAMCESRVDDGRAYYEKTGNSKGVQVQYMANIELGNLYFDLGEKENARKATEAGLKFIEQLAILEPEKSVFHNRAIATSIFTLARVSDPQEAIEMLERAIRLQRSVIVAQPNHSRRKRDLAFMLSLRGSLRIENTTNLAGGIADLKEAATLFVRRVVESPRESATQRDFEEQLFQFTEVLSGAGHSAVVNDICIAAIDQVECIATAQALAGSEDWNEILLRLRSQIEETETAAVPQ